MTTTTAATRPSFPVFCVERDHGTGSLDIRLSFGRVPTITRHLAPGTDLVDHDTMDGGQTGTLTAPVGSQLVETRDGSIGLELPGGTILGAEDAVRAARSPYRSQSFGLGWSPVVEGA